MKFINYAGRIVPGRRPPQGPVVVASEADLAKAVKELSQRVIDLETRVPPPCIEFECELPTEGVIRLMHNFGCAVRWYVTSWKRNTNPGAVNLVEMDALSTSNTLCLTSQASGFAVIRVEPAEAALSGPGASQDEEITGGGSGVGIWQTAYEIDFTSLALTTASADGTFPIDGYDWTVQNYAKSSVMSVGGADGLRLKCGAVNNQIVGTIRTAPIFCSPSMKDLLVDSLGLVPDDMRIGLRVSGYLIDQTIDGFGGDFYNNMDSSGIWVETGAGAVAINDSQRYEMSIANFGGVAYDYHRMTNEAGTRGEGLSQAHNASWNCLQMEITNLGHGQMLCRQATEDSGFPRKWYPVSENTHTVFWPIQMNELDLAHVCFAQAAMDNAGTSEGKWGRLRIEYALWTPWTP